MHIAHLSLTNFRNYGRLELALAPGATLLYGDNAQGKTNLLEAIYYLATTRSPHADQDRQLINWDALQQNEPVVVGRLVAQVAWEDASRQVEMRLIDEENNRAGRDRSFRREALVNRRKVRLMDLLGNVRVVLFLPEDIQLLTGSPSGRRRYMDITLCQIDPIYCRTLSQYNKVLEQRNALLRQIAEGAGGKDVLPVFTEKLAALGGKVFARRGRFWWEMAREAQRIHYEELTDGAETIRIRYLPRLSADGSRRRGELEPLLADEVWLHEQAFEAAKVESLFMERLRGVEAAEIARGTTSVGPHRDDWGVWVNGRDLSSYGSRGQQRSGILSLKLAEIEWMSAQTNESPILLLDEVVAELDERRRRLLLEYVQQATQAILTATDPGMFTEDFLAQATSMRVIDGRVQPENSAAPSN